MDLSCSGKKKKGKKGNQDERPDSPFSVLGGEGGTVSIISSKKEARGGSSTLIVL